MLRDAITPLPHPPAVVRVAVATAVLTTLVLGGTVLVCSLRPHHDPPPVLPTIRVASFTGVQTRPPDPADLELVARELRAYAFETYPRWAATHVERECPQRLLELNRYMPALHAVDPWGTPYRYLCGKQYAVAGVVVRSAGPDGLFDTADDLSSH